MAKKKLLNGTIKVGLGQSKSGKVLDKDTHYYGFSSRSDNEITQENKLVTILSEYNETKKPLFYSHNGRAYVEVNALWIANKIQEIRL